MFLFPQCVVTGGKDNGAEFWDNVDYTLKMNIGKMGLWPGSFFKFEGVSSFGNSIYGDVGAIVPTNVSSIFPGVLQADSGPMGANLPSFLVQKLAYEYPVLRRLNHSLF